MDGEDLKDAVYGGANAKLAIPNEHAGNTGDAVVNAAYAHQYSAPINQGLANAHVNESAVAVEEAKKAAAAAEQAKKDAEDPSKYQRIPRSDGGFGFYDPSGKEITAHDYARVIGSTVDQVLGDSENPIDRGFLQDYKNLQDYMTAWQNNDRKKIDEIQKQSPELKKITSPADLIKRFYQAYPTVYGKGGFGGAHTAGQRLGTNFVPAYQGSDQQDYGVGNSGQIGG